MYVRCIDYGFASLQMKRSGYAVMRQETEGEFVKRANGDSSVRLIRSPETQRRLIAATIDVVFEYGYAGATMAVIAEHAGVTRGAIQHCFGDTRVDLMTAVCADILEQRQQQYSSAMTEFVQADIGVARKGIKEAYRDPSTWFLVEIWIASKSDAVLKERVDAYLKSEHYLADESLERMLDASGSGAVGFREYKYLMRALTRGLALEYSRRPDPELFDRVVDLLVDALSSHLSKDEVGSREHPE